MLPNQTGKKSKNRKINLIFILISCIYSFNHKSLIAVNKKIFLKTKSMIGKVEEVTVLD